MEHLSLLRAGNHIHFIGIGGIGMSGLALLLQRRGIMVSGCDYVLNQPTIELVRSHGCSVTLQKVDATHPYDSALQAIVYNSFVAHDHPEMVAARLRNIPILHRSEILALLMALSESIAITGSHGKTTTTAMLGHVFTEAEQDPTLIVGGILTATGSNIRHGIRGPIIAEADESDRSFLRFKPSHAIITNVDNEHLETYTSTDDIVDTFIRFGHQVAPTGSICIGYENDATLTAQVARALPASQLITYGTHERADLRVSNIQTTAHTITGTLHDQRGSQLLGELTLPIPGRHMLLNGTGVTALALERNIPFGEIAHALSSFRGVEQRFSYRGTFQGAEVFDDYGHHPTEIRCTLPVARARASHQLIVVFQAHRFSRTAALWHDFIEAFQATPIEQLIICDIYHAYEPKNSEITGARLAHALQHHTGYPTTYITTDLGLDLLKQQLQHSAQEGDVILFLGAGPVNRLSQELTRT